jgi:hypothetical protein
MSAEADAVCGAEYGQRSPDRVNTGPASEWFRWAHVGPEAVAAIAGSAGLTSTGEWTDHGRWFTALRRS